MMVELADPDKIFSKRKAISSLFPYAISLGRGAHQGMADEILRVTPIMPHSARFMWRCVESTLFAESSSPSLNRTIALVAPYLTWTNKFCNQSTVDRWAAAVSTVTYTEEVGQSVVDVLLQIASDGSLRPYIADDVWAILKKQVSLPPACRGRLLGTGLDVLLHIRGRRDIDTLKSYYLLIWSEWDSLSDSVIGEMETSIKQDFGGVGMWGHREDLMERLDHILAQLDRKSRSLDQDKLGIGEGGIKQAKERYTKLRDVLLRVNTEALETLTSSFFKFNDRFHKYADSRGRLQDHTRPLIALCLFCVCDCIVRAVSATFRNCMSAFSFLVLLVSS